MSHLLGCAKANSLYAVCTCEKQSRLNLQHELERNTAALQDRASLEEKLTNAESELTALRSEREHWRMSSVNRELAQKLTQAEAEAARARETAARLQNELAGMVLFNALGGRLITRIFQAADMSLPDSSDVGLQLERLLSELSTLRSTVAADKALADLLRSLYAHTATNCVLETMSREPGYEWWRVSLCFDFTENRAAAAHLEIANKLYAAMQPEKPSIHPTDAAPKIIDCRPSHDQR